MFVVEPSFYSTNQYMIGLMHLKLAQAKEWFEKLLKFEVIKDEDTQVIVVLLFILLLSLVLSSLSIVIYF